MEAADVVARRTARGSSVAIGRIDIRIDIGVVERRHTRRRGMVAQLL